MCYHNFKTYKEKLINNLIGGIVYFLPITVLLAAAAIFTDRYG